jgi:hypothetical protein
MPTSFDSTTQTKITCDLLLPRVDPATNRLAVAYTTDGVVLQLRFHQWELAPAPNLQSSTVAAAGSSGINSTSTRGAQPFSFQPTQTMLTRPATLSSAHVSVPSLATVANGASDVAAALPPAPYPPSSTVAASGLSWTNTTSTHGARPFSLQRIQMTPNRLATLSGARVNVPSSETAINEAHGANGAPPQAEPTGGLTLLEEARSSIPTRRVTRASAASASANVSSNGPNAPRRSKRAKRPAQL